MLTHNQPAPPTTLFAKNWAQLPSSRSSQPDSVGCPIVDRMPLHGRTSIPSSSLLPIIEPKFDFGEIPDELVEQIQIVCIASGGEQRRTAMGNRTRQHFNRRRDAHLPNACALFATASSAPSGPPHGRHARRMQLSETNRLGWHSLLISSLALPSSNRQSLLPRAWARLRSLLPLQQYIIHHSLLSFSRS